MKRNIAMAILSVAVILLTILYREERTWHELVENGMTLDCYLNLEHAIAPLAESTNPLGYDEPLTENAVNNTIDDFFAKSVRGNEPKSLKIVVHDALAKLAIEETNAFCDRPGRAADARQTIEEAIEAELHR